MLSAAFPSYTVHIEVWLLVVSLIGLGFYTSRVIQPKAVAAGAAPITAAQKRWFALAVFSFWVAADFPMHDIAEQRLYSVHMIQHAIFLVVFPPAMLLATPTWLARLIIGHGEFRRFVYRFARPAPSLIINLVLTALTHWAWTVNTSIDNAWLHYGLHTLMVFSALLVWMCICGPIPELRVGPPLQMLMLFLLSIIPTVPAAFLTTAEGVLYQGYNHDPRLWGLSVVDDQQLAGIVMKVLTGFYLWILIGAIFFRWSFSQRGGRDKYRGKLVTSDGTVIGRDQDPASVTTASVATTEPPGSAESTAHRPTADH